MSFVGFGDIAKCAQLAFRLYEYGWKSVNNAATQYVEFGQDVYGLHKNLLQLQGVFENVKTSARGHIPGSSSFYDTSALNSILDEPFITIRECHQLLSRRDSFAEAGGAIRNIYWNTFVEAEVSQLHNKIMFHNVKILALLKPLELKLLLDIQSLVTHYGEAILRELERQNSRLFGDGLMAVDQELVRCNQIIIPLYLTRRFEAASKDARPDVQTNNLFPMHDGINAFLTHYQEDAATSTFSRGFILSSPTQSPEQYVSMMKSIWIIQRVQGSAEYAVSCERGNRLLKCFVEDLAQKCLDAFSRYSGKPENPYRVRNEPSEVSILPLGEEAFMTWPKTTQTYDRFDAAAIDTMKTILRAPLLHLNPSRQKEVLLLRQSETVLEMITKETSDTDRISESRSRDIDLRLVSLNPIYADPQCQTPGIEVGLYTLGTRGRDDLLSFRAYNDLYDFQEAITGYRVVEDMVKVDVIVMEDKPTSYHARVQIWDFQSEDSRRGTSTSTSRRSSLAPSSTSTIRRPSDAPSTVSRYPTHSSSPPGSFAPSSQWSSTNSARSATSQITAITSLTETAANHEIEAQLFEVPKEPLLVLFLRSKTPPRHQQLGGGAAGGFLSMLKIPIGAGSAALEMGNCTCNVPARNPACAHACVTGPPKKGLLFGARPLAGERWAGEGMMNLAVLGAYYGGGGEGEAGVGRERGRRERLNHVRLTFGRREDKVRFEGSVGRLGRVDALRWDAYERAKVAMRFKKGR